MHTFYHILEIDRQATADEVKKAYRALQIKHHPDKTGSLPESEQAKSAAISKAANVAYETLSSAALRAAYDLTLTSPSTQFNGGASSFPASTAWNYRTESWSSTSSPEPTPSSTPHPETFPRSLSVDDGDWTFDVHIHGTYQPYEWGPRFIFTSSHKIFLFMKVRKDPLRTFTDDPDVQLSVTGTPHSRRIRKIESLHRTSMTESGPEEQLLITIYTFRATVGTLKTQLNSDTMSFDFAWDLQPRDLEPRFKPPKDELTYASCLVFMVKPPHSKALFNGKPCHEDNPRYVLLNDKSMQTRSGVRCRLSKMRKGFHHERTWATARKVAWDRDNEKMWRLAAFGWQPRGMGKGEEHAWLHCT